MLANGCSPYQNEQGRIWWYHQGTHTSNEDGSIWWYEDGSNWCSGACGPYVKVQEQVQQKLAHVAMQHHEHHQPISPLENPTTTLATPDLSDNRILRAARVTSRLNADA